MRRAQANLDSPSLEDLTEEDPDLTKEDAQDSDTEDDTPSGSMNQQGPIVHEQDPSLWQFMVGRYIGYREVDIPGWLKDYGLYKTGDWKAFKKPRSNGQEEWKYAHWKSEKMFRSKREVKRFLVSTVLQGGDVKKPRKRAGYAGGQSSGTD